jgi:small subunit ribosomal protein S3
VGQKVHPIGFRLGIYRDWLARWVAPKLRNYGDYLIEDLKIRKSLESVLDKGDIAKIEIEKASDSLRIIIHTAKPGLVIGKGGQEVEELRSRLAKEFKKDTVEIFVNEVKKPDLNATLIAKNIAAQLEKRVSYKRTMKRASANAMRLGAEGIKIAVAGRLQGAEIARTEWMRVGRLPLHTLRADIQYGFAEALTTYGMIGVKVWVCLGTVQQNKLQ